MALILSLRQGEDFFLDEERVRVQRIYSNRHFVLETADGTHHEIVQDRMAESVTDVFVSSGDRGGGKRNNEASVGSARLVIDAPREFTILRGVAKRRGVPS